MERRVRVSRPPCEVLLRPGWGLSLLRALALAGSLAIPWLSGEEAAAAPRTTFDLVEGSQAGSARGAVDASAELETFTRFAGSLIEGLSLESTAAFFPWYAAISAAIAVVAAGVSWARLRRRRAKRELAARAFAHALASRQATRSHAVGNGGSPPQGRPRADAIPVAPNPSAGRPAPEVLEPARDLVARRDDLGPREVETSPPQGDQPSAVTAESGSRKACDASFGQDLVDKVFRDAWGMASLNGAPPPSPRAKRAAAPVSTPAIQREPLAAPRRNAPEMKKATAARADGLEALDQALREAWEQALLGLGEAERVPASPPPAPPAPPPAEPALLGGEEHAARAPEPPEEPAEEIPGVPMAVSPSEAKHPPSPARDALGESTAAGSDPTDLEEHVRLCTLLLSRGRVEEAAQLAREGLDRHSGAGCLHFQLSKAEAQLGRVDTALDAARAAHDASGSRESLFHRLRLLLRTRRLTAEDHDWLRKALESDPQEPLVLHAVGASEALHGDPWAARGLLRAALDRERRAEVREEIAAELLRLDAQPPGRDARKPDSSGAHGDGRPSTAERGSAEA